MSETRAACAICRFWHKVSTQEESELADGEGFCRRRAPTAKAVEDAALEEFDAVWPKTAGVDWCGEYEHGVPRNETTEPDYSP